MLLRFRSVKVGYRPPNFARLWLLLAVLALQARSVPAMVEFRPCKNNFSPAQQIQLGDKAKAQVYRQMPVLPDSSPVTKYIQQLGTKLAAHAPGHKWPYNFHVADVADINAFALPGGSIFVNLGTIQAAETEAQLAGVMAHEISHVVLQHAVCNAEREQKVGLIAGLAQLAAGIALGGSTAATLAQEGIGAVTGLGFLKMSRGDEKEADVEGAQILYETGYDPHGLPQFFQIVESKYGKGGAQFLSDHPNPGNRTEYLDEEIASFPPRSHYTVTSPEFKRIKAMVAGMRAYTASEVASGVWKRKSPNQTVSGGVNELGAAAEGSRPDLNTAGAWKTFRGAGFIVQIPENWSVFGDQSGVLMGPSGGIIGATAGGAGRVVYGMVTDVFHAPAGLNSAASVDALLAELARNNPGFTAGRQTTIRINRAVGRSVECSNPAVNGGERDWVLAFPQPDDTLRYFVFVSPAADFARARPTFERILKSLRFHP